MRSRADLRWMPGDRPMAVGRALCVAVLVALLAAVMVGNSWAHHIGGADRTFVPDLDAAQVVASDGSGPQSSPPPPTARPDPGPKDDGQQLLHLLGACMAVLGANLVLLTRLLLRRDDPSRTRTGSGVLARCTSSLRERLRWMPPPFSPPVSSPVLRT